MKEHPILFSTPMVQAILEGRKTMTRRVVKIPDGYLDIIPDEATIRWGFSCFTPKGFISLRSKVKTDKGHNYGEKFIKNPYGNKGDILWVRETFNKFNVEWSGNLINVYKADYKNREWEEWTNDEEGEDKFTWKPSIFMPKAACRIKLEITNIKVERLQDISEEDAKAEGAPCLITDGDCESFYESPDGSFIGGFYKVWEKINGTESWDANPFVWVIEFKKITS